MRSNRQPPALSSQLSAKTRAIWVSLPWLENQTMKPFPRVALVGLALTAAVNVVFAQAPKSSSPTTMSVVRRVGCGCCLKWVEQMEKAGYKATVTESPEIEALKDEKGVPKAARSCRSEERRVGKERRSCVASGN